MLLRTTEFLWQEGHTAHATEEEARHETLTILELYRSFVEDCLALPVVAGEKPANERFPGAVATYSIEAMMQDGKALQAGTSHFLGTNFAAAQNIRYQDKEGGQQLAHTTSWGTTTRLIGAMIMVHGDDDGVRVPPRVAPHQVVIVPILRDSPEDEAVRDYCLELAASLRGQTAFGEPVRAYVDLGAGRAAGKRWAWIKKGAPLVVEVGGRDVAGSAVSVIRRDRLYADGGKLDSRTVARDAFVAGCADQLADIQQTLHGEARRRLEGNIDRSLTSREGLEAYFGGAAPGWAEVAWSRPEGAALDQVVEWLKRHKLTLRNVPLDASPPDRPCVFTGEPAVERVLVSRAY